MRKFVARSVRLRNRVHSELTSLLDPATGPLGTIPGEVTDFLDDACLSEVASEYRALSADAPSEGHAAIITAGPPGAGKTTALEELLHNHRRIDPDKIKDILLARLDRAGLLDERRRYELLDGEPVQPGELAWWVHRASTDVADTVRQVSLSMGENFAMEGTLSWGPLVGDYTGELATFDYESLVVLDVEVPFGVAVEQARARWWADRATTGLGGRFLSDAAIAAYYPDNQRVSTCATRARDLFEEAIDDGLEATLALESRTASGTPSGALIEPTGVSQWRGLSLAAVCIRCGSRLSDIRSIERGLGDDCFHQMH